MRAKDSDTGKLGVAWSDYEPSELEIEIEKLESWNISLAKIAEIRNNLGDYSGAASSEMKVRAIIWTLQQLTKGTSRDYSWPELQISKIEYETYFRARDIPRAVIALDYQLEAFKSYEKYLSDSHAGQIKYVELDRSNLIEEYQTNSYRIHPAFVPTLENYPAIVLRCSKEYVLKVTNILSSAGEDIFPLHTYSQWSRLELMRIAIEQGHDVNGTDNDGFTPIHWAAGHGTPEGVKLLVEIGVNVDQVSTHDWTPLMVAAQSKNLDTVITLIDLGATVSYEGEHGWTPLHIAEYVKCPEIVERLTKSGADVSFRDYLGRLPSEMPESDESE